MSALILDGKAIAAAVRQELKATVTQFRAKGITPGLAVCLVGEDPASDVYVRNKVRACEEVGIRSVELRLPATTTQVELEALIDRWNADDTIDGILVQLPLPKGLDAGPIVARIATHKDVDGFGMENLGQLTAGKPALVACTPAGVMEILRRHSLNTGWSLRGKHAVVVGRSITVGRPMALLLLQANATVTICHSQTADLKSFVSSADLLVAAAGQRHLVQGDWVKPGAVVIDVGIHRGEDGKLSGDVDFAPAAALASAITPVPGGVGPMTIAMLLANTVQACQARRVGA